MREVPCKDCEHREVGCHSKCPSYKEFSEDMAEIRRKRFEESLIRSAHQERKTNGVSYRKN